MTADVFLHETGHAMFDMLEIPFLGREEDAQINFRLTFSCNWILGFAYLGSKQARREMITTFQRFT